MPVLKNSKHERFAQMVAGGKSATAAYRKVYGATQRVAEGNACRVMENDGVSARVEELKKKVEAEFAMTRLEWLESFARLAKKAERSKDYSAARGCLREIGLAMARWYAPEKHEHQIDSFDEFLHKMTHGKE